MNENLSQIQRDLLRLLKGHYGVFNDFNAVETIAALLEPHWLMSRTLCRDLAFQNRELLKTLLACEPDFLQDRDNLFKMLDAFSKAPINGHQFLCEKLIFMPIQKAAPDSRILIDLGEADPAIKERLKDIPFMAPALPTH